MTNLTGKPLLLAMVFAVGHAAFARADGAAETVPHIVEIDRVACDSLTGYVPGGAAYVPGVAAGGGAVAPADLPGSPQYRLRSRYKFEARITPFGPAGHELSESTLTVAEIAVDPLTGRVTLDGQDVSGVDHAVAEACARLYGTGMDAKRK